MSAYNPPQPLPQFDISAFSMTPSTGGSAYPPPSLNLPVFDKSAFPSETTVVEATVPASFTNTQIGTGTLNTNNIQQLTSADVNLYTTITSGMITLGSSILAQLKIYSAWVQIFSPVYYFYNPASTQLWSTRFYPATNAITTLFYADATSTQPSVSLQSKPTTAGDATAFNGWYAMVAGTISMGCQIKTSLEAPLHYLYNYAKTMYKETFFGGSANIYEQYNADSTAPSTPTAYTIISPNIVGDTVPFNGNVSFFSGGFAVNANRNTDLIAPAHYLYNSAQTLTKRLLFGTNTLTETYFADSANTGTSSAAVTVTRNAGTVANTGNMAIACGVYSATASSSKIFASLFTQFNAPSHYFYDFAGAIYTIIGYGTGFIYRDDHADTANPSTITTSIGSRVLTSGTTNYDGQLYVYAREFYCQAGITTTRPITPSYPALYNALTGTGVDGTIGRMYSATYSGGLSTDFLTGGAITYGTLPALGAGVWLLSFYGAYQITGATNITKQQCVISAGAYAPSFSNGIAGNDTTGNAPINTYYLSVTGVLAIPSGTTYTCTAAIGLRFDTAGTIKTQAAYGALNFSFTATRIA